MQPGTTPQLFSHARNFNIQGGQFTAVGGDMHMYAASSERHGMKLLLTNICHGAFHNAADRGDPPRCHPHTRTAIRETMMQWIKATNADRKLIIWLNSPAGAGKTAIEQSIAEQCEEEGLLAASFFFGRTAPGRGDSSHFVATLAYQLLQSIPEIRDLILTAIEDDPALFSRSIDVQMQKLVTMPLRSVAVVSTPRAVVVDGVDECGPDGKAQAKLLIALACMANALQHIPIIFVIASRPEFDISLAFNKKPLRSITKALFLDADYQSDADICLFLRNEFDEIQQKQLAIGTKLPAPWPREGAMDQLVQKSSGQFIFAATVIKYIDSVHRHPVDQLNVILGLADSKGDTPFAALDALYHFILSSVANLPKVLEILTLLLLTTQDRNSLKIPVIEKLFGCEVRRVLVDMHSLLLVPPADDNSTIRIHHASLSDFLMDQSRSNQLFIDRQEGHISLSKQWLGLISRFEHFNGFGTFYGFSLDDCISNFVFHSYAAQDSTAIAEHLSNFNIHSLLKKISVDDLHITDWSILFNYVRLRLEKADIFTRLSCEFYAFFVDRIMQYPPSIQAFIPAVLCHPDVHQSDIYFSILSEVELNLPECDLNLLFLRKKPRRATLHPSEHLRKLKRSDGFLARQRRVLPDNCFLDFDGRVYEYRCKYFFRELFQHMAMSGNNHIRLQDSYLALAKIAIPNLIPPGSNIGYSVVSMVHCLEGLFKGAARDSDLAQLVRECTLRAIGTDQCPHDIIWTSLRYLLMTYGPDYLRHTHTPSTEECIVCKICPDSLVIEDTSISTIVDAPV